MKNLTKTKNRIDTKTNSGSNNDNPKTKTSVESISESLNKFNKIILTIFEEQNKENLKKKLKKLNQNFNNICAHAIVDEGGWKCRDCEKEETSIICQQCWSLIKDKHIDHNILYDTDVNGICDCGDSNILNEKDFCPNHQGLLKNEDDIETYINKCFDEKIINSFKENLDTLFKKFGLYILYYIENKIENEDEDFFDNIDKFLKSIAIFSDNNALILVISELLLKNYKYETKTKHICFKINGNDEYEIIKEETEHECFCPFICLLMSCWKNKNTDILYSLVINYKLKKVMGILYFLLYLRFQKYLIKDFYEMSVQYISEDVSNTTIKINGLFEYYFDGLYEISSYFLDKNKNYNGINIPLMSKIKDYDLLYNFWNRSLDDNVYLFKPISVEILGKKEYIYIKLIDILYLLHFSNPLIAYYPHPTEAEDEKYSENL